MRFENKVAQLRIEKHGGRETGEFLSDVIKMAEGEALEYVLGEVLFCGTKVDLSLRPMIPRAETEHWVAQAITLEKEREAGSEKLEGVIPAKAGIQVLDLFSGSGNVGLAFLKNIKESSVDFIEYDPALKKQIEISLEKNNIDKKRANVMTGDTWGDLQGYPLLATRGTLVRTYDVITAVPPYVPPHMKEEVMRELSAETPLSFFDKEDGYYYHKQVLSHAKDFLKEEGTLYLEFDITQREKIEQLAIENGWTKYSFLRDPYDHECSIRLVK